MEALLQPKGIWNSRKGGRSNWGRRPMISYTELKKEGLKKGVLNAD